MKSEENCLFSSLKKIKFFSDIDPDPHHHGGSDQNGQGLFQRGDHDGARWSRQAINPSLEAAQFATILPFPLNFAIYSFSLFPLSSFSLLL